MELESETGWELHPIGGETGHAYMGTKDHEKLFLKRNSSPFLAALSLEGISPKLIWTKRIGNGDILTAQEWCNGRNLEKLEMKSSRVAEILRKVHCSMSLKRMLERVGGSHITPQDLLRDYKIGLAADLDHHPGLKKAFQLLIEMKNEVIQEADYCVCHGDMSRKNWLLSEENQLYLVDWDSAVLADPAYDLGQLFGRYIGQTDWKSWLDKYGIESNHAFINRIQWYVIITLLMDIKQTHKKGQFHKMNNSILKMNECLNSWRKEEDK